ncbi:hypothetical protein NKDENANG_01328 [Candidatus Entotheonellaceae bacterium PAL068K]
MTDAANTPPTTQPASLRARLLESLRTRTALRQAIMLVEILAPPVASRSNRAPGTTAARPLGRTAMR